jgi:DNA-binding response OmpR family regulator
MVKDDNTNERLSLFGIDTARAAGMKILVVEDDISLAGFLRQFLEEQHFKVYTTSTGEETISLLGKIGEIDIALVDYRLPGMDGLETVEKISQLLPQTVTLIMTGLPTLDSSIRAMRLGASDYILKPFKLEDVAAALKKAMKERSIKLEIKQLRIMAETIEKNASTTTNIKLNENIKNATARNITPGR